MDFISQPELLLAGVEEDETTGLIPDLLISFGGQVVSKRLKIFLQKLPDLVHVEIDGHVEASLDAACGTYLPGPSSPAR